MWLKDQDGELWNLDRAKRLRAVKTRVALELDDDFEVTVFRGSAEEAERVFDFIERDLEAGDIPLCKVSDALELVS